MLLKAPTSEGMSVDLCVRAAVEPHPTAFPPVAEDSRFVSCAEWEGYCGDDSWFTVDSKYVSRAIFRQNIHHSNSNVRNKFG